MIDDPATVSRLLSQMEAAVPIPATPTSQLVHVLREQGVKASTERVLFIQRVFYAGDEGGLSRAIRSYQQIRRQRLADQADRQP